jgi:hypothetical protein
VRREKSEAAKAARTAAKAVANANAGDQQKKNGKLLPIVAIAAVLMIVLVCVITFGGLGGKTNGILLEPVKNGDGLWGYENAEGKLVIPCEWERASGFNNGLARVRNSEKKYGFINQRGESVIPCEWDAVGRLPENVNGLPWKRDDKIFSWTSLREYPTKLIKVRKNGKWGLYDLNGKECYSCTLDKIWRFQDGMAKICEDGKWGLMDEQGHMITPCQWEYIDYFRGETAAVRQNKHWGTIDRKGNLVHPCTHYVGL